jgi:hypothetical protein
MSSTASNSIKTNSIDTVTEGTLTIGGTNTTSVNISENTTVTGTLGATTVTASGGITTPLPILLSYTTLPTFTSNQIGYQDVRTLITTSESLVNDTRTPISFPSGNILLPIGVWSISFGIRFISTGTTLVTGYETYTTYASGIFIGGFILAKTLGLTSYTTTAGSSFSVTSTNNLAINDSINIINTIAGNDLSLEVRVLFTGDPIAVLGETVISPETVATPNTYLIATRIG